MFAVSVDGAMYMIRYSPLGLLCNNVMCRSHDAPLRDGVRLYEQQKDEDPWVHIQWPAQLVDTIPSRRALHLPRIPTATHMLLPKHWSVP